jgi:hypothetical protein
MDGCRSYCDGIIKCVPGYADAAGLIMIKLSLHNHFQVVMQIGSPIFIAFDIKNTIKMETSQQTYLSAQVLDYSVDPRLSAEVKAFLKHNSGSAPVESLSKQDARNMLIAAQASVNVNLSGIEESEKTITADGYTIKLNIVRPTAVTTKLPVFIFIHGGGWVLGDYPTHKRMVRDLSVLSGFCRSVCKLYTIAGGTLPPTD